MADSKNVLKRPIGPLPTWAWVAIVGAVVVVWAWWRSRQSSSSSGTTADASQVPQFVNQTYTSVQPPSAPEPHKDRDKDRDRDADDKHPKRPQRRVPPGRPEPDGGGPGGPPGRGGPASGARHHKKRKGPVHRG